MEEELIKRILPHSDDADDERHKSDHSRDDGKPFRHRSLGDLMTMQQQKQKAPGAGTDNRPDKKIL